MKVLLVTNLFPTPVDPERGVFTLQLAKRMAEKAEVTIVCPLPYFPKLPFLSKFKKWYDFALIPSEYEVDGIKIYSPKYPMVPKVSESWHAKFVAMGLKGCLKKLHKVKQFDVVNSQWFYPDSVAVDKVLDELSIPHIPTGLGCDVNHDLFDKDKREAMQHMLNASSAITVVSNDLKRVLVEDNFNADDIHVIPNGIDFDQFKPVEQSAARKELNLPENESIILYVGRLSEEKNVHSLIKAFAKLEQRPELKLYLVGDGPLREDLENLANELGVNESVIFVGKVEHRLVAVWMGACNYFTLPSYREGCPNVVLESLGSGRPVIASKVGAIPDVVSEDSGILFDPNDINSIANTFKLAFEKEWDYSQIAKSVKSLSWEAAADRYLSVFESTLGSD